MPQLSLLAHSLPLHKPSQMQQLGRKLLPKLHLGLKLKQKLLPKLHLGLKLKLRQQLRCLSEQQAQKLLLKLQQTGQSQWMRSQDPCRSKQKVVLVLRLKVYRSRGSGLVGRRSRAGESALPQVLRAATMKLLKQVHPLRQLLRLMSRSACMLGCTSAYGNVSGFCRFTLIQYS